MSGVIIVGAGHAAGQLAASLRMENYTGNIQIIGDESYPPYERPPLSKQVLSGEMDLDRIYLKPDIFYTENNVELLLGRKVNSIDCLAKFVTLDNGNKLVYDKLAITTGTRVRKLSVPGSDLKNIFYVRSIDDTLNLQKQFTRSGKMVVVGGGYIGLEVAAAATKKGMSVTVLEMTDRVMSRVVAPEVSNFYEKLHLDNGVNIQTGVTVSGFEGKNKSVSGVVCNGNTFEATVVVVGVGVLPNIDIAEDAGLECNNGIVVDEYTQTSNSDIVSAGDCTNHPNPIYGKHIRLESVQNAVDQAKISAKTICGVKEKYSAVPWFWSDQYDVKLQIVGLSDGYDQTIVRGNPNDRSFSVFYFKKEILVAVDAINSPKEFMTGRKMVSAFFKPDPKIIQDIHTPIKELLRNK